MTENELKALAERYISKGGVHKYSGNPFQYQHGIDSPDADRLWLEEVETLDARDRTKFYTYLV